MALCYCTNLSSYGQITCWSSSLFWLWCWLISLVLWWLYLSLLVLMLFWFDAQEPLSIVFFSFPFLSFLQILHFSVVVYYRLFWFYLMGNCHRPLILCSATSFFSTDAVFLVVVALVLNLCFIILKWQFWWIESTIVLSNFVIIRWHLQHHKYTLNHFLGIKFITDASIFHFTKTWNNEMENHKQRINNPEFVHNK